jgi:predicted nucleic acid-binding protein
MPDYLADSNVWLRLADPAHAMFAVADNALAVIESDLGEVFLTPQVVSEYWRVVTSQGSQRGGYGWDAARADLAVQRLEHTYTLLPDGPAVYGHWRQIVLAAGVTGASVFDARLVAVMLAHGLTHLLTFNDDDFRRYARWGITAVNPAGL